MPATHHSDSPVPHGEALPSLTDLTIDFPEAQIICREQICRKFLLEGLADLGNGQIGFVNIYNAQALNHLPGARKGEVSEVYLYDPKNYQLSSIPLPEGCCATAILPTTSDNQAIIITNLGLFSLNLEKLTIQFFQQLKFTSLWEKGTRPNHCTVDPEGNLLISWMGEGSFRDTPGNTQGQLWQVRPDGTETLLLSDLYIPNGHVFIPNGDGNTYTVLLNDTASNLRHSNKSRAIECYQYDPKQAQMSAQGTWFKFPGGNELREFPDGMAINSDYTRLLVPMFLGNGVDVIDVSSQKKIGRIMVPGAAQVTSVALLGTEAFITTASEFYSPTDFSNQPNAGCLASVNLAEQGISAGRPYRFHLFSKT